MIDLFAQINNAVLDLQASELQTFERPLKKLALLLHHPDLEPINRSLIERADFDAFIAASERTGGGMVGSHHLVWPEGHEEQLGITLTLIDRLASDPEWATDWAHRYFYSASNKIMAGIHSLTRQLIIPFVRDYKDYVTNFGKSQQKAVLVGSETLSNKVFIVHGHDEGALQSLARFLEKLNLQTIVLMEQPNQGRTIIQKFEDCSADVGFAVVLLTPDDLGASTEQPEQQARSRQNVIFELGYFAGKLGRSRVCLLRKGNVEIPSDLFGVIYTEMDSGAGWKIQLVRELEAAKLSFDASGVWK